VIPLPEGYTLETTKRRSKQAQASLMGGEWQVVVYHKGYPAFSLAKQYRVDMDSAEYAGKLSGSGGAWHRSFDLTELVKVMCTKHRIGVRHE
jgi:hypothetical protein